MIRNLFLFTTVVLLVACSHHGGMIHGSSTDESHGHSKPMATHTMQGHAATHGAGQMPHHLDQLSPRQVSKRYKFMLSTDPPQPVAGEDFEITVRITDSNGRPVTTLEQNHQRLAHFLLISENLEELHHLHAEDFGLLTHEAIRDARFTIPAKVRWGGRYILRVDFADRGYAVATQFELAMNGPAQPPTQWALNPRRSQDGLALKLNLLPPQPEERSRVECNIEIQDTQGPVTDLEDFLGALTHLAIFREGADISAHVHGGGPELAHAHYVEPALNYRGPKVYFGYRFMKAGRYRIFAQFQRAGTVHTVPFDVEIAESTLSL